MKNSSSLKAGPVTAVAENIETRGHEEAGQRQWKVD